jgi:hypothetical protein
VYLSFLNFTIQIALPASSAKLMITGHVDRFLRAGDQTGADVALEENWTN